MRPDVTVPLDDDASRAIAEQATDIVSIVSRFLHMRWLCVGLGDYWRLNQYGDSLDDNGDRISADRTSVS